MGIWWISRRSQLGLWGTDVYLHNTMAMPGHIHLMLLLGPLLMAFGVIYAIMPDLTKKHMSKNLGEIHFWLTIFGGFGLALLFSAIGAEGAIRREADVQVAFQWAMPWLLFFALSIFAIQDIPAQIPSLCSNYTAYNHRIQNQLTYALRKRRCYCRIHLIILYISLSKIC